ncbi:MAG: GspE/PulE family protein [Candidatus Moranbacteria bacterium]|nr:GspE/PulE family protein [Candidatus Moranbacteria bacterium]
MTHIAADASSSDDVQDTTVPKGRKDALDKILSENKKLASDATEPLDLTVKELSSRAKQLGIEYLTDPIADIDKKTLHFISEDIARKYKMVSFGSDGTTYKIAMSKPQDVEALNVLRFLAQKEQVNIEIYLTPEEVVEKMMSQYAGAERALSEAVLSLKNSYVDGEDAREQEQKSRPDDMEWGVLQDAPIAKLVQVIVKHGVDGRASDIHIEPIDGNYRVRFRVDGMLHASLVLPLDVGRAVVARVKILANLKIDEKRKPQDGRFRFDERGQVIDLRVSTFPVIEGEKVVMRLLDKARGMDDLNTLGLSGRNYEVLTSKIREPYGIILMTGPTGSGKSTSLYAFLSILNQEERNIVTLEDPVEYFLDGINQSQVKPEIGYTFASGLRSILRQDPNVIMVGEIRDSETAELAIHAALTGHLVLSTLHTNNALGAIPRLVDMGIEPFLLASALQAVAAQRLVRKICSHCKEPEVFPPGVIKLVKEALKTVSVEEGKKYGVDLSKEPAFFHGAGCDECHKTGYMGRVAIHEAFEMTARAQEIITEKKNSEAEIASEAVAQGMVTLKQDGLLKALSGLTTLSEIERVTEGSIMVDEE